MCELAQRQMRLAKEANEEMPVKKQIRELQNAVVELNEQVRKEEEATAALREEYYSYAEECEVEKHEYNERAWKYVHEYYEYTVAEMERERRRLTERLAEVTKQLDEERTERLEVEALLEKCGDSLLWWANQAKDQKRLDAELQERIARRVASAAESAERERMAQEASEEVARMEELARLAREAAGHAKKEAKDATERAARLEEEERVAEEVAKAARKVLEESAASAEKEHVLQESAESQGGPGGHEKLTILQVDAMIQESADRAGVPERQAGASGTGGRKGSPNKGAGKSEGKGRGEGGRYTGRVWDL